MLNPKRRIARSIILPVGGLLCGVGILHDVVNIRSVTRAVAGGEIAERLGRQLIANVALAGGTLVLLGSILILVASDLEKGKRLAWRLTVGVGVFLILSGIAGYLWQPIPQVLIFSVVGVVVTGPLLVWRKHFMME